MPFDNKVDSDQWKPRKTQIDTNPNIKSRTQSFSPYRYNLIKKAMILLAKEMLWFSKDFVTNQRKYHQIGLIWRGGSANEFLLCEYYAKTDEKAAD